MRILMPAVATCAAAIMTSTIGLTLPAAADSVTPEVEKKALTDVSEPGLDAPGARAASGGQSAAANQSMTNLPNIMKSDAVLGQMSVANAGVFSGAHVSTMSTAPGSLGDGGAPELGGESEQPSGEASEKPAKPDISGSVKEKTENGVNIAAISDVLTVPEGHSSVIGASYRGSTNVTIEVRVKSADGWSAWQEVEHENGQEQGTEGTEPFIVNSASAVQMRVLGEKAPEKAELVLVDPKFSPADDQAVAQNTPVIDTTPAAGSDDTAPEAGPNGSGQGEGSQGESEQGSSEQGGTDGGTGAGDDTSAGETDAAQSGYQAQNAAAYVPGTAEVTNTAMKKVPAPSFGSRKSWGANESWKKGSPSYAPGIKAAVIHHTSGSNNYKASDVPGILRGIYSFHTKGRGWSDVGYNMLADKYGRLWEGRAGGAEKAVIGAHVRGYNTGTFGISVMGTFNAAAPPTATLQAVEHAIAWKLSGSGVPAKGKTTVAGKRINTIVGHRDLGNTDCPGTAFYAKIPGMRNAIEKIQNSGQPPQEEKPKPKPEPKPEPKPDPKPKPEVKTPIQQYADANADKLGKPTGDEYGFQGGTARDFEKGAVFHKAGKTYLVSGAIRGLYRDGMRDTLGFPASDESGGLKNGGAYQLFEKGSVHWSPKTGAQPTYGILQKYWGAKGYERGHLGYPAGKPECTGDRCEQLFEGARLAWSKGYGTTEFSPKGSIGGGVIDRNAPPGDKSKDDDSSAGDGEGSADDKNKDKDKGKGDKQDPPKKNPPKKDPPKKDPPKKDPPKKDPPKKDPPKKDPPKKKGDKGLTEKQQRAAIVKTAQKGLGVRYVWGGNTTSGWDCSGYTVWVYKQHGIQLPRHSTAQKNAGKVIPASQAKPGDMIWTPGHIGIVSETKGQMYDAGSKRTGTSKRSYSWMLKRGAVFIRVVD